MFSLDQYDEGTIKNRATFLDSPKAFSTMKKFNIPPRDASPDAKQRHWLKVDKEMKESFEI